MRKTWSEILPPVLLAALAGAAGGCYDPAKIEAFLDEPRPLVSGVDYHILPPDIVRIASTHVLEIHGLTQQVRPDGHINLPLVGEIDVAGKTPRQVEELIVAAAMRYYGQADATVEIVQFNSQRYYVFGHVARAGPMPWTGHDTLLDALAAAQPTVLAAPNRILLVRGSAPAEGGQGDCQPSVRYRWTGVHPPRSDCPPKVVKINLWAMVKSGDMAANVLLLPNDVIYVQPNHLAAIGLAVQNLLFPIRPAVETVGAPARASAVTGGL